MSLVSRTTTRVATLTVLVVVLATSVTSTLAQPIQQAPKPPGLPTTTFLEYLDLQYELDRVLRQPCVDPRRQQEVLKKVKDRIQKFLDYAKDAAAWKETKISEQEARDYASVLNRKYIELQNKKPCPAGGAGATTPGTSGTTSGTPGGGTNAGGTTGVTPPPSDTPPCPDSEKGKQAQEKYDEALGDFTLIDQMLTELSQDLAKADKIVSDYDAAVNAASNDPAQQQALSQDFERRRAADDARAEARGIRDKMQKLRDAQRKASEAMDKARSELSELGKDPDAPCDPKDSFMMAPAAPGGMFAGVPTEPTFSNVSMDSLDADFGDGIVENAVDAAGSCCETGVQKLAVHLTVKVQVPKPKMARATPLLPLVGEWIAALGRSIRGPQTAASAVWGAPIPVDRDVWLAPATQPLNAVALQPFQTVITSLGTSQGEAFQLQIINDSPVAVRLSGDAIVVEPLKRAARNELQKTLQKMAPKLREATTVKVEGYCLNYALQPPDAGMLFRIASPDTQAQFAVARRVLGATSTLNRLGLLGPDTNAKTYLESIKQYAVWTSLERWDLKQFSDAWVETTRKQMAGLKRQWTTQMETTLRAAAPGRWSDIQLILSAAR